MIDIKSSHELELIAEAGKVVRIILGELRHKARPCMLTSELGRTAEQLIEKFNARSAFKGYRGFPGVI